MSEMARLSHKKSPRTKKFYQKMQKLGIESKKRKLGITPIDLPQVKD